MSKTGFSAYPTKGGNYCPDSLELKKGGLQVHLTVDLQFLGPLGPIAYSHSHREIVRFILGLPSYRERDLLSIASSVLIKYNRNLISRWTAIVLIRIHLYSKEFDGIMKDPIEYLLYNLMFGARYAKYLKDLRANMFQRLLGNFNSTDFTRKYEEIRDMNWLPVPNEEGCSYDEILNERFLIHYEENSVDFFDYPFREVDIDEGQLHNFRYKLDEFFGKLNRPIIPPSNEEMRSWITDSTSMNDELSSSVNRTLMRNLARGGDLSFLQRSDSRFLRSVINVGPANTRDAWQCDVPTLFKVKKVSYMMKQVVCRHKRSCMASEAISRRRRKLLKNEADSFLLLDIKKCGISLPRQLFLEVAEACRRAGIDCYDELISIATGKVVSNGKEYEPVRGSGLGNLNEVTTLIQCIICDIAVAQRKIKNGVFYNDDGVMTVSDEDYFSLPKMISLYRKLGVIMNTEKSFISKYNVFCEDYETGSFDFTKRHLRVLSVSSLFEQNNIPEQKSVYGSIIRDLDIYSEGKLGIIGNFEYHKFEKILPICFGGWMNTTYGGVNLVLDYLADPSKYLGADDRGLVPLMNKFITFILMNKEEYLDIFFKRKRFPYRGEKVKNPFNATFLNLDLYDLDKLDPIILRNGYKSYEDLYNFRGLKNAKPKIKGNFSEYNRRRRYSFFRRFWREKEGISSMVKRCTGSTWHIMRFLREDENLSKNLVPPLYFAEEGEIDFHFLRKRKVIYSRSDNRSVGDDVSRVNTLISLASEEMRTDVMTEPLTRLLSPRGESFFAHEKGVYECEFKVPDFFSLFFRDKKFFCSVFYTVYGIVPTRWIDWQPGELDVKKYRSNIYGILLGEEAGELVRDIDEVPRARLIFRSITKGRMLNSIEAIELAADLTWNLYNHSKIKHHDLDEDVTRIFRDEPDIDMLNDLYPGLVNDYLVEIEEDIELICTDDEDELFADDDYSRMDLIDIYTGTEDFMT